MTLPKPIPMLLALLGVVTMASAIAGLWMALTQTPPAWFFLGFEVVIALSAVFLVMLGTGKIKEGPAITMVCAAGAIGAGALLGWQATGRQINGHSVTWLLAVRAGIAGLLLLAAAAEIAIRDPKRTLPRIGWGLATGLPLLVLLVLFQRGVLGSGIGRIAGNSPALAAGVWMIVGLIAGALLSISGHMLITGFQIGVRAWDLKAGGTDENGAGARPATSRAPSSKPSESKD